MRLPILVGVGAIVGLLAACDQPAGFDHYILALSWQPAFCERNGQKPECRGLDDGDFAATNLVLHGLWPSEADGAHPAYCGVASTERAMDEGSQWCALPALETDDQTRTELQKFMPGSLSCLDRHEWLKHGTCSGLAADAYFDLATRLTEGFAATGLATYLRSNVGKEVPLRRLVDAFAAEFGAGAGAALDVTCRRWDGHAYLVELRLALKPDAIDKPLTGKSLFVGNRERRETCAKTVVIDPAGPG